MYELRWYRAPSVLRNKGAFYFKEASTMIEKLEQLTKELQKRIQEIQQLKDLQALKVEVLSKKGTFASFMEILKQVPTEQKPVLGQKINEAKKLITQWIDKKSEQLEQEALKAKLEAEKIDVTLPGYSCQCGSKHPMNIVIDEIIEIFLPLGYHVEEGPEVEKDHYNFEMLNIPKNHPARDMQDTFYITENELLRTHTSPVQARTMEKNTEKTPIKILCPGKVYRRDDDDATHSHQFMQLEALVIDKNITMAHLKATLDLVAKKLFGAKREIRLRSSYFPFTEPSVEVDVSCTCQKKGCPICKDTGWIEILGAGMVHPNVLKMGGYDPEVYQGFAIGFGIDRITMLKYGFDDIRHLYNNDLRVISQFVKER